MISISPRRHRRSTRRGLVAVVAGALLAPLMMAQPAGAGPALDGSVAAAAAAGTPIEDHSTAMPRTRQNEVTGDFLNKGYAQRAIVESGNLNIYDSAMKGGGLLRSTPTDLSEPTTDQYDAFFFGWGATASDNRLAAIALAWAPGSGFFMAGRNGSGLNYLYSLPADGSCASERCAAWVKPLPGLGFLGEFPTTITTTALAVGTIGTKPVVAAGLSHQGPSETKPGGTPMAGGIYVFDEENGAVLGTYSDLLEFELPTVVTALDWDDNGSGLLAIGAASPFYDLYALRVSANGTFSNLTRWDVQQQALTPIALSAAVGHRPDGSPVVAYGMSDGRVKLWDPAVTSQSLLAEFTGSPDAVNAVTFTDRIDGSVGVPDVVAVSSRGNSARVLRYAGGTTLAAQPVAPNKGTVTDVGGIRAWFPGYKTGEVRFIGLGGVFELDFATRPNPAYGCWFAQDFADRPALPSTPVTVNEAGFTTFALAGLTAGLGGDCAATDFTGQWAAYVTITPVGQPANRTVAKLVVSRSGQLTVKSTGGPLKLSVAHSAGSHPLGTWLISIQVPPQPTYVTPIKLVGTRLDPAGTDRPVYRFDVPATTWPMFTSTPARVQTVMRPMRVRGCVDTGECSDLGLLVPQGKPSRATSTGITLAPVSFYWQDHPNKPKLDSLFVYVNPGAGSSSNTIVLDDLPAPAAGPTVGQVAVCPASGSSDSSCATADPMANGLDQAPLRIQLYDANNNVLPVDGSPSSPYGRVYYTDEDGEVVTGLIPADGTNYIRVSPYAGAYSNDQSLVNSTSTTGRPPVPPPVGGRFGYLSTNNRVHQQLTAHVGGSILASDAIPVEAVNVIPEPEQAPQAGHGFHLTGCSGDNNDGYCNLYPVSTTTPGLFLTNDPITNELRIGLQFATTAQTAAGSLPLQQVAFQNEHTVAAANVTVGPTDVHLATTSSFQPADTIDTWLITHGTQVAVRDIQVGGGN